MQKWKRRIIGGGGIALLVIAGLGWLFFYGRFWIPRVIVPPEGVVPVTVEMETTSYCHCGRCCSYKWFLFIPYQKRGAVSFRLKHIGITSSGAMVRPGSLAADTSIYPYGTVMHIPGYGYGMVEDTGGAIKGQHIDLYRPNHLFARRWGRQTLPVKVWLPPSEEPVIAVDVKEVPSIVQEALDSVGTNRMEELVVPLSGPTNKVAPSAAEE